MKQRELARDFFAGEASGSASNVEIQQLAGGTALVGYGHAVYAYRYYTGHVVYFHGWQGYSIATNSQLGKMGFTINGEPVDSPSLSKTYRGIKSDPVLRGDKFHVVGGKPSVSSLANWLDDYDEPFFDSQSESSRIDSQTESQSWL